MGLRDEEEKAGALKILRSARYFAERSLCAEKVLLKISMV